MRPWRCPSPSPLPRRRGHLNQPRTTPRWPTPRRVWTYVTRNVTRRSVPPEILAIYRAVRNVRAAHTPTLERNEKAPARTRGLLRFDPRSVLPIVRVAVVVQRNRGTGGLAEVRAVVLILVGRDRVRRSAGFFCRLHLDVAVPVDAGTGRDELADDHVLLQTLQLVAAAVDRRIGQHSRGLLERRRRQPRVGRQRRLRDTHQHRATGRGLAALGNHPTVLGLELATFGQRAGQELRRARIDDRDATQHPPDDHLDVLVVDRHALSAVDLLDLLDEVDLHLAGTLDAKHLVRVGGAFHQLLAHLDVVAVGEQPLGAVVVLEHLQALTTGELVVDHFLATIVGNDGDLVEALALLEAHATGDVGARRLVPRNPGLEEFLHAGQTTHDVAATRNTALVERTHGQLRAGFADGLGGDDADRLADVDELARRHRTAVAHRAHAGTRRAGQHGTDLHLGDARREQRLDRRVAQVVAALDDHVALLVQRIGGQRPRVRGGFDVLIADQRLVLQLGQRDVDAALGLAIGLANDHVL